MLLYLDSATNRKSHPNENYAREIMELFSLGEGNYSEQDIRELARCFTGWEVKRKEFRFNRYQYDTGTKTVLGTTGQLAGEDGVNVVASQDATPKFLTRKLLRFFLLDEDEIPADLVEPLARTASRRPAADRTDGPDEFWAATCSSRHSSADGRSVRRSNSALAFCWRWTGPPIVFSWPMLSSS